MASTMKVTRSSCLTSKRSDSIVRPAFSSARTVSIVKPASSSAAAKRPAAFSTSTPRSIVTRVAAAEAPASTKSETKEWYALVASADFYFNDVQNESMAEQLRERVRFFKEQNREIDFWIVPEPKWLDAKYPQQAKQVKRPAVALVSTDKQWIVFMKLRLDRVLRIDLGAVSQDEVLQVGGEIPNYQIDKEKWTAPYGRYAPGWWNVFIPKN